MGRKRFLISETEEGTNLPFHVEHELTNEDEIQLNKVLSGETLLIQSNHSITISDSFEIEDTSTLELIGFMEIL